MAAARAALQGVPAWRECGPHCRKCRHGGNVARPAGSAGTARNCGMAGAQSCVATVRPTCKECRYRRGSAGWALVYAQIMSRRSVRFRPPALALTPAIRWMLLRAFGPAGAAAPAADPAEALALCVRFELAGRVAARQGRARLAAELGAAAAARFAREQAAVAGAGLRILGLAEQVAALAAPLGLPLVLLKFAALELGNALAPGSRAACDLDVLVPADRAGELQQALVGGGFRASPMPPQEHQLAALEGAAGIVEVHRMLLGVRVAGRRSASVEDLDRAGLLRPLPALAGKAAVPLPAVAAAHALVHGIAQHGWTPHAYSLFKMLADLVDLGFAGPGGEELASRAAPWLVRDVAAAEVEAARQLCAALAAGADLAAWERSPAPAAVLLRHALAGRLDPDYERALRLALFRRQPSDAPEVARLARAVASTVWLSHAQVDAIYGPPRRRLGYFGRRLGRPLDLVARLGRYGLRAWNLRRRRPA